MLPERKRHSNTEDEKRTLLEIDKALAEKSLKHYMLQAWDVVEPSHKMIWGWHLDAIVEHLMAVSKLIIRNLIINIPPRHTKSLGTSVMWPTWEWGPNNRPHLRMIYSSYSGDLSIRDAVKSRRLIKSPYYQLFWGDRFSLVGDQNAKMRYENNKTGFRISTSVGGVATGEGGDILVCDDPHNIKDTESTATRLNTLVWWDEVMSTRVNNPKTAAKVIIMQRSHENDLTGHIISKELGYDLLILPMRYEIKRKRNLQTRTPLDFKDPRKKEGELLNPIRYGEKEVTDLEKQLGEYGTAAQLQQRPSPRGGGMFKVDNFKFCKAVDKSKVFRSVRYWDKAATEDGGKRSAGVLMHKMKNGNFVIEHIRKGQWGAAKREKLINQQCQIDNNDYPETITWIEQEPGSGGKESAESTVKNLAGYVVRVDKVGKSDGNKELRAEPYSVQIEAGNVYLVVGDWNRSFIDEHEVAPKGKLKDQWDAAAGAFNKLTKSKMVRRIY